MTPDRNNFPQYMYWQALLVCIVGFLLLGGPITALWRHDLSYLLMGWWWAITLWLFTVYYVNPVGRRQFDDWLHRRR